MAYMAGGLRCSVEDFCSLLKSQELKDCMKRCKELIQGDNSWANFTNAREAKIIDRSVRRRKRNLGESELLTSEEEDINQYKKYRRMLSDVDVSGSEEEEEGDEDEDEDSSDEEEEEDNGKENASEKDKKQKEVVHKARVRMT